MVSSIIGGPQQQYPASKAFQPNQAPNNPSNTPNVSQGPQPGKAEPTFVQPGKTEEINSKVALSRDTTRIDPSQISNNSSQRGQNIDISV